MPVCVAAESRLSLKTEVGYIANPMKRPTGVLVKMHFLAGNTGKNIIIQEYKRDIIMENKLITIAIIGLLLPVSPVLSQQMSEDERIPDYEADERVVYEEQRQSELEEQMRKERETYQREYEEFLQAWRAGDVTVDAVEESDSLALVEFYESTNGDEWEDNTNWLEEGQPVGTWYGVSVEEGNITELVLIRNNLSGEIPVELADLNDMWRLMLHRNEIEGEIPPGLGNLVNLESLSLYSNNLEGAIPPELGNLASLEVLMLHVNDLEGLIPPELGNLTNLEELWLYSNDFEGEIPPELGDLTSLERLWLRSSNLKGGIPPELGNLTNLKELRLRNNDFEGEIPPQLGNLTSLKLLWLQRNNLEGEIPPELGDLENLEDLRLRSNNLEGEIPEELGNLDALERLSLGRDNLEGPIPQELGNLANLRFIQLGFNNLEGEIPLWLTDLANLRSIRIGWSNLEGEIPPELAELENLERLRLWGNNLEGTIPPELGDLENLEWLNLNDNELKGEIPPDLGRLENLEELRLKGNAFEGDIPESITNLTELVSDWRTDFSYNMLTAPNEEVRSFMDEKDEGWHLTQTVPPDNVEVSQEEFEPVRVSWEPVSVEQELPGYYRVGYGIEPGEYDEFVNTESIEDSKVYLSGLEGDTEYYIGVQTHTPEHHRNLNDLSSSFSNEASITVTEPPEFTVYYNNPESWENVYAYVWEEVEEEAVEILEEWPGLPMKPPEEGNIWYSFEVPGNFNRVIFNNAGEGEQTEDFVRNEDGWFDGEQWYDEEPDLSLPDEERQALISLYEATNGDDWQNNDGWKVNGEFNVAGTEGRWHGVTVEDQSVTELNLRFNDLKGEIPSELGALQNLEILSLNSNDLSGDVPKSLGELTSLKELNLRSNELSGEIPIELGQLFNLYELRLDVNELTGEIPTELSNIENLRTLHLYQNELSGNIPPQLGDLEELERLRLRLNNLSGEIPAELSKLPNLVRLDLGGNDLTGEIPSEFNELSNLERLELSGIGLSGEIPDWLGDLPNLQMIRLSFNDLSGEIPAELGELKNLRWLYLQGNNLSGGVPKELGELENLGWLDISRNMISGTLPKELAGISNLNGLRLSENAFEGEIPDWIFDYEELEHLELNENRFSGELPEELSKLDNLTRLELSKNKFSGEIPEQIGELTELERLQLSGNRLEGEVPPSFKNLTDLDPRWTSFGYNKLKATDEEVLKFLEEIDEGWQSTQTIPPAGLQLRQKKGGFLNVSWSAVDLSQLSGGYIVNYGTQKDELDESVTTSSKMDTLQVFSDFQSNTEYFFAIQTKTDAHNQNPNQLVSEFSDTVSIVLESSELEITYNDSWNLLATPFKPEEPKFLSLFPEATGDHVYSFNGSYEETGEMQPGAGYWVQFVEAGSQEVRGDFVTKLELELNKGWNLIAGPSAGVTRAQISDPDWILAQTPMYSFDSTYQPADSVRPGKGYWVHADSAGTITLDTGIDAEVLERQEDEQPALITFSEAAEEYTAQLNRLDFQTAEGDHSQTLYFGDVPDDEEVRALFHLPPVPPVEVFDVRFEGDQRLTGADSKEIRLAPGTEMDEVEVNYDPSGEEKENWVLQKLDEEREVKESHNLTENETVQLQIGEAKRKLRLGTEEAVSSPKEEIPEEFALEQNYPNPFNPVTVISYQLPESSEVTLEVFNMLGQRVTTLVNETQEAGRYEVSFDASQLSSGAYLYRIQADDFIETRQMMFVK